MSYKRQELLTLRERLGSLTGFGVVRVAHCFNFCVVCVCLRPVSLECSFLIVLPGFPNVAFISVLYCSLFRK